MEQVLAPKFNFIPKNPDNTAIPGVDYGKDGYDPNGNNVGLDPENGEIVVEFKGMATPRSKKAKDICRDGINEIIQRLLQDFYSLEQGLFNLEAVPQEITQYRLGKIIHEAHPDLDQNDIEAIRQRAVASFVAIQQGKGQSNPEDPKPK